MRITGLHIDRFGVWTDLKMDGLDDGMTVFYGPNEAGKSTLMQYIRTVLYGFAPDRCQRFVTGKRSNNGTLIAADTELGGSLFSSTRDGDWHIRRLADAADPLARPGEVRVTGPDAQPEGAQRLNTLLSGIDEAIFNNVFAVGLREMQQLGALNDTQAARQLYSLSTGTDRVSLVDVTRQLQQTRCRLVGCDDQSSLLGELVAQQNRCRTTIDQLSTNADRWASMVAERDAMEEEIKRLESTREKSTNRTRLAQMVLEVQPQWEELRRVDRELENLGSVSKVAPRTIDAIRALAGEAEAQRQRIDELRMRRELLREQISQLNNNESVGRHSARILAMLDQRREIGAIDARVLQLQNDLDETELEILAEQERLGLRWDSAAESAAVVSEARENDSISHTSTGKLSRAERKRRGKVKPRRTGPQSVGPQDIADGRDARHRDPLTETEKAYEHASGQVTRRANSHNEILPVFDSAMIAALQEPAVSLERERQMLEVTKKESASYKEEARRIEREIATALGHAPDWFDNRDDDDVMRALENTTELTTALRRQASLQREFEEIEDDLSEVEDRRETALTSQLLPWDLVKALGALFTIGSGLVLSSLFGESFGWSDTQRGVLLMMGLVAAGVAAFLKFSLDSPGRDGLRDTDMRNDELKRALSALEKEQTSLQEKLTAHNIGSLGLRETETRLVQLEALLPLEQQRRGTLELAEQASQRAIEIAKTMKQTRVRWEQSLRALGLSTRITPEQMRALSGQSGNLTQLHRIRGQKATELEETRREQQRIGERIRDLLADAMIRPVGDQPSDHLNQLANALQQQNDLEKKREDLKQEDQRLKREQSNGNSRLSQLQRNRRSQIAATGALDEADLERMQQERERYEELSEYRIAVRESIQTLQSNFSGAGGTDQSEVIRRELERDDVTELPKRLARAQADLEHSESRLKDLQYRCGEINEQIKQLTADRSLGKTHLELNAFQYHIDKGVEKWKIVSTISGLLKGVYSKYEKDRQPETLKDASRHLTKMTNGRYTRIWTPLADDRLVVDDADGKSMPVEVLSRGTREQLFLSLRLALISCYARRGIKMPVVLDDVLVNFDAERTEAAATVLADFARTGHQVLVFTCHKHIRELFENLQADVRELPDNGNRNIGVTRIDSAIPQPAAIEEPIAPIPVALVTPLPVAQPALAPTLPVATHPILGFADEFPPEMPAEYIAEWHSDTLETTAPSRHEPRPLAFAAVETGALLGAVGAPGMIDNMGSSTLRDYVNFDDFAYSSPPTNRDTVVSPRSDSWKPSRPQIDDLAPLYATPPSATSSGFNEIMPETQKVEYEDAFAESPFDTPPTATANSRQIPDITSLAEAPRQFDVPYTENKAPVRTPLPKVSRPAFENPEKKRRLADNIDSKKRDEDRQPIQPMIESANLHSSKTEPLPPLLPERDSSRASEVRESASVEQKRPKRRTNSPKTTKAVADTKRGLLKPGFATQKTGLLKPGFATRRAANLPTEPAAIAAKLADKKLTSLPPTSFSDSVRHFLSDETVSETDKPERTRHVPASTLVDHEAITEPTMNDPSMTNAHRESDDTMEQEELLTNEVASEEDEYEYVEVDVDEDGNEIVASDEDDEYEYVDADEDDDEEVAEGEEDEYEYVEVDVDEDGNEIAASKEEEYEFVEVDEDEVEDDEYEYVEVDVDEDGNEIEASDDDEDEEDEYEYVEVDVDEDGNEIEASDDDEDEEDEYEYVEVDVDEDGNEIEASDDDEYEDDADTESKSMPSFGDVTDALKRKLSDVTEDLLDDQDAA